jgi:glutathione S-transferase
MHLLGPLSTFALAMSSTTPTIKLTYFDIAGRGEPVRLALALSKTPFEDERINFAQWGELKPKTPNGQLPLLTIDGEVKTQSMAMLRYIGATYSDTLYPREKLFDIEEALGLIEDLRNSWAPAHYMGMSPKNFGHPEDFGKTEEGKEVVKQLRTNWLETKLPDFVKSITAMIAKHGGVWIASKDHPTIADVYAYCSLESYTRGFMDHVPTDSLDKYPEIKEYLQRFLDLPEVKAWYAKTK